MAKSKKTEPQPKPKGPLFEPVIDLRLFAAVDCLCRQILARDNTPVHRALVGNVLQSIRTLAHSNLGHDSPECVSMVELLRRTDPNAKEKARDVRGDVLDHLFDLERLDASQLSSCYFIREVWDAFGRFLFVGASGFQKGSGTKKESALSPFDVMDQEIYMLWQSVYVPWYNAIRYKPVLRKDGTKATTITSIVFNIVVEGLFPADLDKALHLEAGKCVEVLKAALDEFYPDGKPTIINIKVPGVTFME